VLKVRVVRLPNTAVPEEFEALAGDPEVDFAFIERPEELGAPDMVILPGSRATIPDLQFMRERGMERAIREAVGRGALLFGICGGFQMMGAELHDPERLEGGAAHTRGLGIFPLTTTFTGERIDEPVEATAAPGSFMEAGESVRGFELHGGRSALLDDRVLPLFREQARGCPDCPLAIAAPDFAAIGTYLHGVLADPVFRRRLLDHLLTRRRTRRSPGERTDS
jgi:adenosylcobyric acid synthase